MKALNKEVKTLAQYGFDEFTNIILFKCPWLNPSTNHHKCFKLFTGFCMRFLGLRSSFIPSAISNLLSQSFPSVYQSSELIFDLKKFSSLKEIKTYLKSHLTVDNIRIERNNETIGSSIEEDLTPFNDVECCRILLALWKRYGENYTEGKWHVFTNDTKQFVASNSKSIHTLLYNDYLLTMQEKIMMNFRENMEWHFNEVGKKIVELVCKLIKEFPLSSSIILNKLFERFPYRRLPVEQQYYYFKLILSIANKCINMEEAILSFCMEKLLLIEADTKTHDRDTILLDPEVIKMDIEKSNRRIYNDTECKINAILSLLFDYFDNRLVDNEFADMMLRIFEERILPTHKTNYIQYVIMYLLAIPSFGVFREKFVSLLVIQSMNQKVFIERRVTLLSYFASVIGTLTFLDSSFILQALRLYIMEYENKEETIDAYFVESLIYISYYRINLLKEHKDILNSIIKIIFKKETLQTNLLQCLLNAIKAEEYTNKKAIIKEIEGGTKKVRRKEITMYWFFGGFNNLPIIKQRLKGILPYQQDSTPKKVFKAKSKY